MKKVLVFTQSGVGGAERISVTVTKSLNPQSYKVIYYLIDRDGDNVNSIQSFIPVNLERHIIDKCNTIKLLLQILGAFVKEKPDVVFSSVLYLNCKILLFRLLFPKTKFIIRCDNYLYTYTDKQQKRIEKYYKNANVIIAQTEEMQSELCKLNVIYKNKTIVLHNPIDTDTIDYYIQQSKSPFHDSGKLRFVASGRFDEQKGFDLLVQAYKLVHSELPLSELYIIGKTGGENNQYNKYIQQLIHENQLEDNVHCIGYQDNPYHYFAFADCFVLSSRWEGLPNVMIEALYLGTPIAAFRCIPIIERIIDEGYNGYTASPNNIQELAKAMVKASALGRVKSKYKPASIQDFHRLFDSCNHD